MEQAFSARRKRLLRALGDGAAIFFSSPGALSGGEHPNGGRQESNFFYLTGFNEVDAALVLLGGGRPRSVLYVAEKNPDFERWNGARLGTRRAESRFEVDEVRDFSRLAKELPQLLSRSELLHFAAGANQYADNLVWKLYKRENAPRADGPNSLHDSRLLLSEMRFVKDKHEIQNIKAVAELSAQAFKQIAPKLKLGASECHIARLLETEFARRGGDGLGFPTIVACGNNATFLHHTPTSGRLKKKELLLIDAGASLGGYSADISRTFPLSAGFSSVQSEIYDLVLAAHRAATAKARPGGSLASMHHAAAKTFSVGLRELGVLKGSSSQILSTGRYQRFFMHRIGHFLGLDVHDVNPVYRAKNKLRQSSWERPFVAGNVLTVEPGLYFDAHDSSIPKRFRGIGVRIEDDLLITAKGLLVLTEAMPRERKEIEQLVR